MSKLTLKAARINAGYTQDRAAKALGVSVSSIQNWELNRVSPRLKEYVQMCKLYSVSLDDIDFFSDED